MKTLLKSISLLLCVITVLLSLPSTSSAAAVEDKAPFDVDALSALLMDSATGEVLYAKNAAEALPPASVTKIMTLLLVMEAIDAGQLSLEDKVQVSEYAASMGGSQVYLEPGEEMKCEDLLKSVIIASANDAAVTLAERVSGSVQAFVVRMNERAKELGMESSSFENPTGLDDNVTNHVTSAYDIALMSRELLKQKDTRIHLDMDGHDTRRRIRTYEHEQAHPLLQRRNGTENRIDIEGEILHKRNGGARRHAPDRGHNGRSDERRAERGGKNSARLGLCKLFRLQRRRSRCGECPRHGRSERNVRVQIRRIQRTSRIVEARQDYG